MTGGKHAALIAVSTTGGLVALVSLWMMLDPISTGRLLWVPGGAFGIAGAAVYVAGGGRSIRHAILGAIVGTGAVVVCMSVLTLVSQVGDFGLQGGLLVGPVVLAWYAWTVTIVVGIPAVAGACFAALPIMILRIRFRRSAPDNEHADS